MWLTIEVGWTNLETHHSQWTTVEQTIANYNRKGLNVIFNGVSEDEFKRISTAKVAKDSWTTLETVNEGTKALKTSIKG